MGLEIGNGKSVIFIIPSNYGQSNSTMIWQWALGLYPWWNRGCKHSSADNCYREMTTGGGTHNWGSDEIIQCVFNRINPAIS